MIYFAKAMLVSGACGTAMVVVFLSLVKFGLVFASLIGLAP
jgi:hypothetical protein